MGNNEPANPLRSPLADALLSALEAAMPAQWLPGGIGTGAIDLGRRIGQQGWTFPMAATPAQAFALMEAAQASPIDLVFVDYYDNRGGYQLLKRDLLRKRACDRWRPLLVQAIEVVEAGHHLVAVPALLTLLEAAIAQATRAGCSTQVPSLVQRITVKSLPDSITRAIWTSVHEFVRLVFAGHPFVGERPTLLNRHWVLHGRDKVDWNRADCLRLLQAIDTIRFVDTNNPAPDD